MIKLILFDIDGTLVLTGGAGVRSMNRAFEDVFGVADAFAGISMGGRTDSWILSESLRRHELSPDPARLQQFHNRYVNYLAAAVHEPGPRKGVMPGVRELLDALAGRDDVFPALLTGNFREGARIKLEYFDLWRYFRCGAFGDGAAERNPLLFKALAEVEACSGLAISPADTFVIGDTPLDVAVAVAGGARSLAVATGSHGVDALQASGADVVLEDLADLGRVFGALDLRAEVRGRGAEPRAV